MKKIKVREEGNRKTGREWEGDKVAGKEEEQVRGEKERKHRRLEGEHKKKERKDQTNNTQTGKKEGRENRKKA